MLVVLLEYEMTRTFLIGPCSTRHHHCNAITVSECRHAETHYLPTSGRNGAAAVELAIVLPLLVVVAFGCVDFGQFGSVWVALTNAVRAGAEYGANHQVTTGTQSQWEADILAATTQEMSETPGFDAESLEVTIDLTAGTDGTRRVTLNAVYEFKPVIGSYGLPETIQLNRQSTMQLLP